MKVILTDDHRIVRDGIRWMLDTEPDVDIVGEAGDGSTLLSLLDDLKADVVLLDIRMPGLSGLDTLDRIIERGHDVAVLMLTMYDEPELVAAAVEKGARGYLLKSAKRSELIKAIRALHGGGSYLQDELVGPFLQRIAKRPDREVLPELSATERKILQLVAIGRANHEIAVELGMTEPAVKAALRRVFEKLHAGSRAEAAAIGIRLSLID